MAFGQEIIGGNKVFRRLQSTSLHVKSVICIGISLAILAGGLVLNVYISNHSLQNHIAELNTRTLQLQVETMDNVLGGVEMFLMREVLTSEAFRNVAYADGDKDEITLAKARLMQELVDEISFINWDGGFFLYSDERGMQLVVKGRYDRNLQFEISDAISAFLQGGDTERKSARWALAEYNGSYLLVRGYYSDGLLLGAWIPVSEFISQHYTDVENQDDEIRLFSEDGTVLASSADSAQEAAGRDRSRKADRLVVYVSSGVAPITWAYSADYTRSAQGDSYRIAGVVIFSSLFVLIALLWWWMYRSVLKSISVMVTAIRKMDYNDLNLRLPAEGHASEFKLLFKTFNGMITTIKNLKTDIVNKTVEKEKVEIEGLQLQIKPHFFLNSMNIIYELAELKNYELIQTMTRCIMEYLRYSFSRVDEMITWGKEISYIESYITMQKMRYQGLLGFKLDASSVDPQIKLPPFLIQPFIENAIKYGAAADKCLNIVMDAWQEDDEVLITIRDSGAGFPDEVLTAFHDGAPIAREDGTACVGIENVKKRLYYSFGERATLEIYNDGEQDATVEITIPVITGESEKLDAEMTG